MKTTRFILTALAVLGFVSCQKESVNPGNDAVSENIEISDQVLTFTATNEAAESKTYNESGVVTWAAGEIIFVWTDKADCNSSSYEGKAVKVTLDAANISEDKRTATFEVGGLPAGATKYFAAAMDNANNVWNLNADGTVTSNAASHLKSENNYTYRTHISVASCTPSDLSLSFKNVLCVLKWHNKASKKIGSLTVVANDGGFVTSRFKASTVSGTVTLLDDANRSNSFTQKYCGSGEYLYIPLASGITYGDGLTFTLYSSNTPDASSSYGVVKTGGFTTIAGSMLNMGDIIDRVEKVYTSNYEKWNDGKDFVIGGKTYNKATNGNATLVTEDKSIDNWGNAVYFIKEGVSVTCKNLGSTSSVPEPTNIVIGDKPGTRSGLTLGGDSYANCNGADNVVLYNLNVQAADMNSKIFRTTNNKSMNFIMDDCSFTYGAAILDASADGQVLNNLVIVNSDIDLSGMSGTAHMTPMLRYARTAAGTGSSIILKNNVIYASSAKQLCVIGTQNRTPAPITYDKVEISDNSFYNVASVSNSNDYAFVGISNVGTSVVINNNLAYVPSGNRFNIVKATAETRASLWSRCTVGADNRINTDPHGSQSGWGTGFVVGWSGGDGEWLNAKYYISENPFSSFDTATGVGVKKTAYANNGASR